MTINTVRRSLILSGAAAALAAPSIVRAQAPVTLRVHHFLPAQSNQHTLWLMPWGERVGRESNGRIKVEVYPSMQLGGRPPQLFDQSKDGIVDIVWTLAGNTPGRFPRLEVFELPFIAADKAEPTSQAVWDFYEKYSKDELKEVKTLAVFVHGKGNIYTKDRVVKSAADMKGLKIRVPSRPINDTLQLMGASPQSIPAPGVPEALAKGVVDGVVMPFEIVPSLKLDELTNRASVFEGNRALYTVVFLYTMNLAKYNSLPPDLRKVIDDNSGAGLSRQLGKFFDEWDKQGEAAVIKANMPITKIGGADLAGWKSQSEPVTKAWIEGRDKAGDKGGELVKAAQDLVAKYAG
ncbi:MAG: TRAP transporter substrate-binding protein [Proteobacteria bacterium]|nr:TRAP transporter substrate-binding protein [Pseudomonadota bacterium]